MSAEVEGWLPEHWYGGISTYKWSVAYAIATSSWYGTNWFAIVPYDQSIPAQVQVCPCVCDILSFLPKEAKYITEKQAYNKRQTVRITTIKKVKDDVNTDSRQTLMTCL